MDGSRVDGWATRREMFSYRTAEGSIHQIYSELLNSPIDTTLIPDTIRRRKRMRGSIPENRGVQQEFRETDIKARNSVVEVSEEEDVGEGVLLPIFYLSALIKSLVRINHFQDNNNIWLFLTKQNNFFCLFGGKESQYFSPEFLLIGHFLLKL
jgi:hypothetical protein